MDKGRTQEPAAKPSAARARFCTCVFEKIENGAAVYLRKSNKDGESMLTTNRAEAHELHPGPVGEITGATFALNAKGEALLGAIE